LWDEIFSVDLRAPFILCQEAVKHMKASGGSILNIGSVNAHFGKRNLLAYSAAKGGLTIFTRNLANDLVRYQIRVNQINPGWVLIRSQPMDTPRRVLIVSVESVAMLLVVRRSRGGPREERSLSFTWRVGGTTSAEPPAIGDPRADTTQPYNAGHPIVISDPAS